MEIRNTIRIEDPQGGDMVWVLPPKLDEMVNNCSEGSKLALLKSITLFLTKISLFVTGTVLGTYSTHSLVEVSKSINAHTEELLRRYYEP